MTNTKIVISTNKNTTTNRLSDPEQAPKECDIMYGVKLAYIRQGSGLLRSHVIAVANGGRPPQGLISKDQIQPGCNRHGST